MAMDSVDDVLLEADDRMSKSVSVLHDQLAGIRTGKASPALVENLSVLYYGAATRLREIAGITIPDHKLVVINAYDPTALPAIEKAILAANLGLTPMNDGKLIRVPVPELSEERRKELTKVARRMAEEARIAIRNVRRDANEHVKTLQKDGKIGEDERDAGLKEVQNTTDSCMKKVDDLIARKEKDVMEV